MSGQINAKREDWFVINAKRRTEPATGPEHMTGRGKGEVRWCEEKTRRRLGMDGV